MYCNKSLNIGDNEKQGGLKAAYEGNLQLLSMLIQEGLCSVNERDERGSTLAHKGIMRELSIFISFY